MLNIFSYVLYLISALYYSIRSTNFRLLFINLLFKVESWANDYIFHIAVIKFVLKHF